MLFHKANSRLVRFKIKYKLFLAFILTISVVLLLTTAMMKSSFQRGFLNYINETEAEQLKTMAVKLEQLYAVQTNWNFIQAQPQLWHELFRPSVKQSPFAGQKPPPRPAFLDHPPPHPFQEGFFFPSELGKPPPRANFPVNNDPLNIGGRIALLDAAGNLLVGQPSALIAAKKQKILVNNKLVGYLTLEPLRGVEKRVDISFAQQQTQAIYAIALLGLVIAGSVALLIAHHVTMPIKRLVNGARALTSGIFEQRIEVKTQDELALLADNFNVLAATLERNRTQQRQWIADISHELRTPLAILRGEIEAIEDGVRDFSPAALQSLANEVQRLHSLIEDLYQLSLSDSGALRYKKQPVDLIALLQERLAAFSERLEKQSIHLSVQFPPRVIFQGDAQRLGQLFSNLLENTLRYTDSGGQLALRCRVEKDNIILTFADSKPAVPEQAMEKLFDRLYRVDESRSRQHGGSGLGLAICKNIVQAHHGTIAACHSELGGLCIEIKLPQHSI